MELLIGCGGSRQKKVTVDGDFSWKDLKTLDNNPFHKPDIVFNLEEITLPFPDNSIDEIHAYEVLEHTGYQGDHEFFFKQFSEFYRVLKPDGYLIGTCPAWNNQWAFGDPSHKRVLCRETFWFLNQRLYTAWVGNNAMSDFRYLFKGDFEEVYYAQYEGQLSFQFILKVIKPSRISI
jgi:SAM-dependent methyltransferase